MSDDWVIQLMQKQATKQQHEDAERLKAQHAMAGAPKVFERLCACIQKDIDAFHNLDGDRALFYQAGAGTFRVRRRNYPSVTLDVELKMISINYNRMCTFDETSQCETQQGVLRIWADLRGNVQIYKNGSPFVDELEVSQFLLEPVLTYVNSQ